MYVMKLELFQALRNARTILIRPLSNSIYITVTNIKIKPTVYAKLCAMHITAGVNSY